MSLDGLCEGASKHFREVHVEPRSLFLRQVVTLPRPGRTVRESPDTKSERERLAEATAPRLQVDLAQPLEPAMGRWQPVDLLEEAERDDERCERVRDRGVAPVEQTKSPASVHVPQM